MKLLLAILMAVLLAVSVPVDAGDFYSDERLVAQHPMVTVLAEGVYSIPTDGGERLFAFGRGGMEFMISRLDEIIEDIDHTADDKIIMDLRNAQIELIEAVENREKTVAFGQPEDPQFQLSNDESGYLCAAYYDLSANAGGQGPDVVAASATSGFQQWYNGPPPPPDFNATLTTLAKADGPYTLIDTDEKTFPVEGWNYVSADPASVSLGPWWGCMSSEAYSWITIPNCSVEEYRMVSETYSNC